jgi:SAM-dependent methyltransferase
VRDPGSFRTPAIGPARSGPPPMTTRAPSDIEHPLFARVFHRVMRPGEGERILACRREMLAGVAGDVVEVGAGDGANFALYPPAVTGVTAVEPEPYLRAAAARAAAGAPVAVAVESGRADRLPVEDASADAVVFSLVLCSVADPAAALAEARRVLRPGGELRVFEHVIADHPVGRAVLRGAQATFWPRLCGNCHPARDTSAAIRAAGFETEPLRRFTLRPGGLSPPMPVIVGRAPIAGRPSA